MQPQEVACHAAITEEFPIEFDDIGRLIFIFVYKSLYSPFNSRVAYANLKLAHCFWRSGHMPGHCLIEFPGIFVALFIEYVLSASAKNIG